MLGTPCILHFLIIVLFPAMISLRYRISQRTIQLFYVDLFKIEQMRVETEWIEPCFAVGGHCVIFCVVFSPLERPSEVTVTPIGHSLDYLGYFYIFMLGIYQGISHPLEHPIARELYPIIFQVIHILGGNLLVGPINGTNLPQFASISILIDNNLKKLRIMRAQMGQNLPDLSLQLLQFDFCGIIAIFNDNDLVEDITVKMKKWI